MVTHARVFGPADEPSRRGEQPSGTLEIGAGARPNLSLPQGFQGSPAAGVPEQGHPRRSPQDNRGTRSRHPLMRSLWLGCARCSLEATPLGCVACSGKASCPMKHGPCTWISPLKSKAFRGTPVSPYLSIKPIGRILHCFTEQVGFLFHICDRPF